MEALFYFIQGFTQISKDILIVVDVQNQCLRLISRSSGSTSSFSGQCESPGYQDGQPGLFRSPVSVTIDRNDQRWLLVCDHMNSAVRTVDVSSGDAGTFVKSEMLYRIRGMTQKDNGDFYITASNAIFIIIYSTKEVVHISGSQSDKSGYIDGTLANSRFNRPDNLFVVQPGTLLVADAFNNKLRLVNITSNMVRTVNVNGSTDLRRPSSMLQTHNSFYVGYYKMILQVHCEYIIY